MGVRTQKLRKVTKATIDRHNAVFLEQARYHDTQIGDLYSVIVDGKWITDRDTYELFRKYLAIRGIALPE